MDKLVAMREDDVGPGPPYHPCIVQTKLMEADAPCDAYDPPRRHYINAGDNPCSKHWVTDARAEEFIREANAHTRRRTREEERASIDTP